jgi:hypothetical protein
LRRGSLRSRGLAFSAQSAYYHVIGSRTQPEGCVFQSATLEKGTGSTMRPRRWGGVVLMAPALGAYSNAGGEDLCHIPTP